MKNLFVKIYVYLLMIVAFLNIVFATIYHYSPSMVNLVLLTLSTILEFPLLVLSIIIIFYISVKKLGKLYLVLPIIHLVVYAGLVVFGLIMRLKGIDPFDMSYSSNIIGDIISYIFYFFQIFFGIYLLSKKKKIFLLLILLIPLYILLFLFLLLPQQNMIGFQNNLTLVDYNIKTYLSNINVEFNNYDQEFNGVDMMATNYLSDSYFEKMDERVSLLKKQITDLEIEITAYRDAKKKININRLPSDGKIIVERIDKNLDLYLENKTLIQSCLDNITFYKEFIRLLEEKNKLIEQWTNADDAISNCLDSKEYSKASQKTKEIKDVLAKIQQNLKQREDTGFQTPIQLLTDSYSKYIEAYDIYDRYLALPTDDENLYIEFLTLYAEASELNTKDRTEREFVDDVDRHYQENIGVCLSLLKS